jgi:hypothetical protein
MASCSKQFHHVRHLNAGVKPGGICYLCSVRSARQPRLLNHFDAASTAPFSYFLATFCPACCIGLLPRNLHYRCDQQGTKDVRKTIRPLSSMVGTWLSSCPTSLKNEKLLKNIPSYATYQCWLKTWLYLLPLFRAAAHVNHASVTTSTLRRQLPFPFSWKISSYMLAWCITEGFSLQMRSTWY